MAVQHGHVSAHFCLAGIPQVDGKFRGLLETLVELVAQWHLLTEEEQKILRVEKALLKSLSINDSWLVRHPSDVRGYGSMSTVDGLPAPASVMDTRSPPLLILRSCQLNPPNSSTAAAWSWMLCWSQVSVKMRAQQSLILRCLASQSHTVHLISLFIIYHHSLILTLVLSSLGRSNRSGWMVKRCRGQWLSQSLLLLIRNLCILLKCWRLCFGNEQNISPLPWIPQIFSILLRIKKLSRKWSRTLDGLAHCSSNLKTLIGWNSYNDNSHHYCCKTCGSVQLMRIYTSSISRWVQYSIVYDDCTWGYCR